MTDTRLKDLCVFDLDGTLIPHDSFSRLVKAHLWTQPALLMAAIRRRVGLLDRAGFANKAQAALNDKLSSKTFVEAFCEDIKSDAIANRIDLISTWRAKGATVILLSASPAAYVVPLGEMLGFDQSFGSTEVDGTFRHLHGAEKRRFIDERFPQSEWRRAFAIADHPSDEPLLDAFAEVMRV